MILMRKNMEMKDYTYAYLSVWVGMIQNDTIIYFKSQQKLKWRSQLWNQITKWNVIGSPSEPHKNWEDGCHYEIHMKIY